MPSFDATILCSTVLISFWISTAERLKKKSDEENCRSGKKSELNRKKAQFYDLLFVIHSDGWRFAVLQQIKCFIMHCMNQARQNYIVLVTSLLSLHRRNGISLSFVWFYCLKIQKRGTKKCLLRTMIIIL